MLKAVIFDFDGIIVNTEPLHYKAYQEVLQHLDLGYSWDDYVNFYIGFDDRDAFRERFKKAGHRLSKEELACLVDDKAAAFQRLIKNGVEPYPGVAELIQSLSGKIPLGLCSGALRQDIDPILQNLKLEKSFDVIVTADDVAVSKPDPACYALTIKRLQQKFSKNEITPSQCIAIEDTPAGIQSARGAGLKVLAVTNSYAAAQLGPADRVLSSLRDIRFDEHHKEILFTN